MRELHETELRQEFGASELRLESFCLKPISLQTKLGIAVKCERARQSLHAQFDKNRPIINRSVLILTNDFYTHYNDVIKAVKNGDIKEDTINKACKRIISWKLRYLDFESNNINKTVEKKLGKNSAIDGDDIKTINRYYKKTSSTGKLVAVLVSVFVALGIFAIVFIICIYKKKKQPAVENAQDSLNKFPINNK